MYRTNTEDAPISQYYTTNYRPGATPRPPLLSVSSVSTHQRLRRAVSPRRRRPTLNKVPHRSQRVQVVRDRVRIVPRRPPTSCTCSW